MDLSPSVKSETKAKFDALLKAALIKKSKKSNSKENLISDDDSICTEEIDVCAKSALNVENKTYIMDKFLNDSSVEPQDIIDEVIFIKPPIPKPRTKQINKTENSSSNSSVGTYNLEPPKRGHKRIDKQGGGDAINNLEAIQIDANNDSSSSAVEAQKALSDELTNVQANAQELELLELHYEDELKPKQRLKTKHKSSELSDKTYNYEHIIGITLHRTDRLELDSYVIHPIIKIHIVDGANGEYLKKSDITRSVLFYYENHAIEYIGPILSQAFDLQANRSLHPNWEETILINEDFEYFSTNYDVIIFFEVIDFLSISIINESTNKGSGWHKIAWGFLKPNSNNFTNIDKKVRLQLYYPKKGKSHTYPPEKCDIFHWWQSKRFNKYPSTLHVSVKRTIPPNKVDTFRSKNPHEIENAHKSCELTKKITSETIKALHEVIYNQDDDVIWSRLAHQTCKIPNNCIAKLESCDDGCLLTKFSHCGKYLACSVSIGNANAVIIYAILTGEEVARLPGHQGLIYGIDWSKSDAMLITASADCTVVVWNLDTFKFQQMLPHPSFVYSCVIGDNTIATGCYDKLLRIWKMADNTFELTQELERHGGYITTVCFNNDGTKLFSGDSSGMICEWRLSQDAQWKFKREISVLDIRGTIINQILLHKREKRLLINTRDSFIRLVDLKTSFVLLEYEGALNARVQTTVAFSSCGDYVISGSEDGLIHYWNTDTAKSEYICKPYNSKLSIHCVQFHPKDNYLAASHYGTRLPILLFKYERVRGIHEDTKTTSINDDAFGGVVMSAARDGSVNFKQILKKINEIVTP